MSDSVLSLADSEGAERGGHWGSESQALLRRYLPQFYAPEPSQETVPPTQASLLFRDRRDQAADIPLTQDFIQEYDRVSKEPRLRTPATLRRTFRFRPQDFEKFFSPEVLSPEILRVADRRPQGNPLQDRRFKECDKKWAKMAEASRTSLRFAAYSGALANLLGQANELGVTQEDRETLCSLLMSLSEACSPWSQATRTAFYTTRQRRIQTLQAMGFPSQNADEICKSIPFEGPYLFAGRALQVFDNETAYRQRADETARRFHQSRKPRGFRHPGAHTRAPRLNARSQSRSQDRTLATAAAADTVAVAEPGPTRPAGDPDSPLFVADPGTGRAFDLLPRALGPAGPVGCCLQAFLPAWAAIAHDGFTLSMIGSGFTIHLNQPLPGGTLRSLPKAGTARFRANIATEIRALLVMQAIRRVHDHPLLCRSPFFVVPNRSGKFRIS